MLSNLNTDILQHILHKKGDFNTLALAVFAYQYQHITSYQRYCQQLNKTPENIRRWQEIPAVSTEVFRELPLCTFPPETARHVFQTSGTSDEIKGKHYYHDMQLYDAAIQASFMKNLGLVLKSDTQEIFLQRSLFRILTPTFQEVSTSSLFYMFQQVVDWYGDAQSQYYFNNNDLNCEKLVQDLLRDIKENRPVVLLGTAFSWVNFFDYLEEHSIRLVLPESSRLMETGGLKGRTRTVSREALYQLFHTQLGLPLDNCYSEYGMTELSSQCYSLPNTHHFISPHWMPVQIIHPETRCEVAVGETGLVQFFDLANMTAISAVLTSDLAIKHTEGFELIGRAPKAILRGCSTVFE